jgi:chemotaxis protein MotB
MSGTGMQPIIKKVIKKGHGGAHGGSWKVAYADFVTAMMAFFLLLWLVSMVSEDKRARVSEYFKHFSLFDKSGTSFMMDNQASKTKIEVVATEDTGSNSSENDKADTSIISSLNNSKDVGGSTADKIKETLKKEIELKLSNMKDQVLVDIYEGAIRIEIVDKKDGKAMFSSGSREMSEDGKRALRVIAENIRDIQGKIAIEGHTDATNFAGSQYSNWELSTERASAARTELENGGMSPDRLIRVAGYAATEPLIKDDAFDPRNRRISIKVFPEGDQSIPENISKVPETGTQEKKESIKVKITKPESKTVDPIDNYLLTK